MNRHRQIELVKRKIFIKKIYQKSERRREQHSDTTAIPLIQLKIIKIKKKMFCKVLLKKTAGRQAKPIISLGTADVDREGDIQIKYV